MAQGWPKKLARIPAATISLQSFKSIKRKLKMNAWILTQTILKTTMYNLPLDNTLKKSHDTAIGADEIYYQLLKHLPRDSLVVLLNIFNYIWASGDIPECWKEATAVPIPK